MQTVQQQCHCRVRSGTVPLIICQGELDIAYIQLLIYCLCNRQRQLLRIRDPKVKSLPGEGMHCVCIIANKS